MELVGTPHILLYLFFSFLYWFWLLLRLLANIHVVSSNDLDVQLEEFLWFKAIERVAEVSFLEAQALLNTFVEEIQFRFSTFAFIATSLRLFEYIFQFDLGFK